MQYHTDDFMDMNTDTESMPSDNENLVSTPTLRKVSAQLLDNLSANYGDKIVPFILQRIDEVFLNQSKWQPKEAIILALGAVSSGSLTELSKYLDKIIPLLLKETSSDEKYLRSISCWTLSRYSSWLTKYDECLGVYVECMTKCLFDSQPVVKIAACTSLSYYIRGSSESFSKYLPIILKATYEAFEKYESKSIGNLLDLIGYISTNFRAYLKKSEFSELKPILGLLMSLWSNLQISSNVLPILLECFDSVITCIGSYSLEVSEQFCVKCLSYMEWALKRITESEIDNSEEIELYTKSIDIICSLIKENKAAVEEMFKSKGVEKMLIFSLLFQKECSIKQYALSLLGDIVHYAPRIISHENIEGIMNILLKGLIPELSKDNQITNVALVNNSVWALSEMVYNFKDSLIAMCDSYILALKALLLTPKIIKPLADIICGLIGRYAVICPDKLAKHMHDILKQWCFIARGFNPNKPDTFEVIAGMGNVILNMNQAQLADVGFYLECTTNFTTITENMKATLLKVCIHVKTQIGEERFNAFPSVLLERLKEKLT